MSGEFKGTPGPWHVMRGDVLDKNGRMVASIEGFCPGEAEIYDAQLISVSPKMLEVLQIIQQKMSSFITLANEIGINADDGFYLCAAMEAERMARDVIAEALGEKQ